MASDTVVCVRESRFVENMHSSAGPRYVYKEPLSGEKRLYIDTVLHGVSGSRIRRLLVPILQTKRALVARRILTEKRLTCLDVSATKILRILQKHSADMLEKVFGSFRLSPLGDCLVESAKLLNETLHLPSAQDDFLAFLSEKMLPKACLDGQTLIFEGEAAESAGVHVVLQGSVTKTRGNPSGPTVTAHYDQSDNISHGGLSRGSGHTRSTAQTLQQDDLMSKLSNPSSPSAGDRVAGTLSSCDDRFGGRLEECVAPCVIGLEEALCSSVHERYVCATAVDVNVPFVDCVFIHARDLQEFFISTFCTRYRGIIKGFSLRGDKVPAVSQQLTSAQITKFREQLKVAREKVLVSYFPLTENQIRLRV